MYFMKQYFQKFQQNIQVQNTFRKISAENSENNKYFEYKYMYSTHTLNTSI